jgi:hypothetical protein
MWTMDYPAKYLVGSIFCAVILQGQEPTPSATASRIPLRSHHDDSGMPEGAQQPQSVPELLPKSNALPGTGAGAFDPVPNPVPNASATPTPTPISPEQQKRNEVLRCGVLDRSSYLSNRGVH